MVKGRKPVTAAAWPGSAYIGLGRDGRGYNPLDILAQEHQRLHMLCDALEEIADDLPDVFDRALCGIAARTLKHDLPLHHLAEDEGLFPLLKARVRPEDNFDTVLVQLSAEHDMDDDLSRELVELLESMAEGIVPRNPDMAGYMLRSYFESYRRHMSIEDGLIFPLARARLTPDDLRRLMDAILAIRL